jgi:hypothetical protein
MARAVRRSLGVVFLRARIAESAISPKGKGIRAAGRINGEQTAAPVNPTPSAERPLSRASRPFMGPILKVGKGRFQSSNPSGSPSVRFDPLTHANASCPCLKPSPFPGSGTRLYQVLSAVYASTFAAAARVAPKSSRALGASRTVRYFETFSFFLKFIDATSEPWHSESSLDERHLNAPDKSGRIRIAWAKRKGTAKRQAFMRHSRHEGLAPVRYSQKLETGSGSFAGEFLAGHRIDRPVLFRKAPVRGRMSRDPWTPGFPFRALAARGR